MELDIEQGTNEWRMQRLGLCTGSRVFDIIPGKRGAYKAIREKYQMMLLTERLTGEPVDVYVTQAMEFGKNFENMAKRVFTERTGIAIEEQSFILSDQVSQFGASPDGILETGEVLEVKVPNSDTHIETLLTGEINDRYIYQIMAELLVTGCQSAMFVSFDPRMPEELQLFTKPVEIDEEKMCKMIEEIDLFNKELLEKELKIHETYM